MARARTSSWVILIALLAMSAARPAGAISPSFLMVYGGSLKQPVIIKLEGGINSAFVWDSVFRKPTGEPGGKLQISDLAPKLSGRAFLSIAIFWGPYEASKLKASEASQHGRLYLPTASEPAVMVTTPPDMQPVARPIPDRLEGFTAGWTWTPQDLRDATTLGIPGLK